MMTYRNASTVLEEEAGGRAGAARKRLPVDLYVSHEHFGFELANLWPKAWLLAGRESDVVEYGDYFVLPLPMLHTSIIVVRGKDGVLRAFHNRCPHRGSALVAPGAGKCSRFVCPFHAWTFGSDGRLVGAPLKSSFTDVDWAQVALSPVSVDSWGGFVFVNLGSEPCALRDYLAPLDARHEAFCAHEDWTWSSGDRIMANCNWKLLIDGQIDIYHPSYLHNSVLPLDLKAEDRWFKLFPRSMGVPASFTILGPEVPERTSHEGFGGMARRTSGVMDVAMKHGMRGGQIADTPGSIHKLAAGILNETGNPRWNFDGYAIVPNTFLHLSHQQIVVQRAWPLDPHRSIMEWDIFKPKAAANFGERFSDLTTAVLGRHINAQDIHVAETAHDNYRSGGIDELLFSEFEAPIMAYEQRLYEISRCGRLEAGVKNRG